MRRTLIQLDEDTYQKLRQRAFREERSIASLVREMLANGLAAGAARKKPAGVNQFLSVRAGRSKQRRPSRVSERHDEALAEAFEK